MSTRQEKNRTVNGARNLVFSTLSFVVICSALVFGMSVFFRVSELSVTGAERYSVQEIEEASGVKKGDSLVLLNREAVAGRIQSQLLYVGGVKLTRKLPNTLLIAVEESAGTAVIETGEGLWLMDESARLLEPCPRDEAESYIRIIGLSAVKPVAGEAASVPEEDRLKLGYLQELLQAVSAQEMAQEIQSLDLSKPANIELSYQEGRFQVRLGGKEKLEQKLSLLQEVADQLEEGEKGVIDLSQNKRAQFSPSAE